MQAEHNRSAINYIIKQTICQDMKKEFLTIAIKLLEVLGLVFAFAALITFIMNEMG